MQMQTLNKIYILYWQLRAQQRRDRQPAEQV
jgi:hypothetical protein